MVTAIYMAFSFFLLWLEKIWLVCGIGLCLLAGVEIVFYLLEKTEQGDDPRSQADGYRYEQAISWPVSYFQEWSSAIMRFRWEPYVYWRPEPFYGQYITIDEQGLRKTWQASVDVVPTVPYPTIFLFGGSTMWGEGVRDDFTIASQLASLLYEAGICARVVNFAQLGYVSTQEVVTLLRVLATGDIPSLVIFYDGYNDILSAVENGIAGVPYKEWHRRNEYGLSKRQRGLGMALLRNLHITQMFVRKQTGRERVMRQSVTEDQLIEKIMHIYAANVEIVEALSKQFGFQPLFFWQPTIFHKHALTAYEQEEARSIEHSKSYFLKIYRSMRTHPLFSTTPNFRNLDSLFAEEKRPYYIDWAHLTEGGNRKVARRIVAEALPLLQKRPQAQAR